MTTETPDLQAVLQRLQKMEKQDRRLKRAGLVALLLAGGLLLMGQARPNRIVEANEFVLKDSNGRTRAILNVAERETPAGKLQSAGLVLYDESSKPRAQVVVTADGEPDVVLSDSKGRIQVLLEGGADGPFFRLFDGNSQQRIVLGTGPNGPALGFYDGHGNVRVGLSIEGNQALLLFMNAEGKVIHSTP